jgi:hypothetical protein
VQTVLILSATIFVRDQPAHRSALHGAGPSHDATDEPTSSVIRWSPPVGLILGRMSPRQRRGAVAAPADPIKRASASACSQPRVFGGALAYLLGRTTSGATSRGGLLYGGPRLGSPGDECRRAGAAAVGRSVSWCLRAGVACGGRTGGTSHQGRVCRVDVRAVGCWAYRVPGACDSSDAGMCVSRRSGWVWNHGRVAGAV